MSRRALLIGIDNYLDADLKLAAPKNDVTELARVLSRTGFAAGAIQVLIGSAGAALSANSLRKQVRDFFRSAGHDDDLLILISGHGMEQGGHRLIVPNDYYLEDPQPPSSLLGDHFLYGEAVKSQARSIVILIDACREGVRFRLVEDKTVPEEDREYGGDVPSVVIVYSCARNERSRADGGEGGMSFFTAAWCAVLAADNDIATLPDVLDAVDKELRRQLSARGLPQQAVTLCERPITGRAGPPECLLIKENRAARTRQRIAASRWCRELASTPFWSRIQQSWPAAAAQMEWIALCAEETFRQAEHKLPHQRWRDEHAPGRALRRLELLLGGRSDVLSISELAVALVLPFVYEGVLAAGELLLTKQGDPLNPPEQSPASRPWLAWRNALAAEEAFGRRTALLRSQGATDVATDLIAWQLVRFLHTSGELWEYSSNDLKNTVGWASDLLHSWFEPAPFAHVSADTQVTRLLSGRRLVRLARLAFATPDDIELERGEAREDRLQTGLLVGPPDLERRVNEPMLAHVLNLAFSLATDARRLSSVFAEHLGRPKHVTAQFLQQSLREITWQMRADTLDAVLDCPHEVIDLALADAVDSLNRHRLALNQCAGLPDALVASMPRFFGAAAVRARTGVDGRPIYKVPHLRLALDPARIREILMGEQLYGHATLALRELFQNALDACRYRRARTQYLRSIGKLVDEYVGRIEFRAGIEDERVFIECRDNGIGMAERHVQNLFARAGSRFIDSHEFHLEKARWAEQGIDFWPNSRFGIGVYSYFMMADEVRVETRRLKNDGFDCEPGLILSVVGSGSLFRVQRGDGISPGTVVRLYLNDPALADAMTRSICEWLWIPEFETQLFALDGTCTRFVAGQPSPAAMEEVGDMVAVPESAGVNGRARLFWALGSEAKLGTYADAYILVDGIRTECDSKKLPSAGVVLNLTEDVRVDLSVDRLRVKDLRNVAEWLGAQIRAGAYRYLLDLPNLHLLHLNEAFVNKPLALSLLDRMLRAADRSLVANAVIDERGHSVPLAGLGLSPMLDHLAFDAWNEAGGVDDFLTADFRFDLGRARSAVARMVTARIRALVEAAPSVMPPMWHRLAAFARQNQWQDQPSLGLLIALDSDYQPADAKQEWAMRPEEVAALMAPLSECLPEDVWSSYAAESTEEISLEDFIRNVKTLAPVHIALAAVRFHKPLAEVVAVANRVRAQPFELPNLQVLQQHLPGSRRALALLSPAALAHASRFDADESDLEFLDVEFDAGRFGSDMPEQLTLNYLLFAAYCMQVSLGTVIEWVEPLRSWGVSVADVSGLPEHLLRDVKVPDWFRYERTDGYNPQVSLPLFQLAAAARAAGITAVEMLELLQPFQSRGIDMPAVSEVPEQPLGELSWELMNAPFIGEDELPSELTRRDLALAALTWGMPLDRVIEAAQPLRDWSVMVPDRYSMPAGLVPKEAVKDLLLLTDSAVDAAGVRPEYSLAAIVDAERLWEQSLNSVLNTLRPWVDLLFDRPLPSTPFKMDKYFKALLATQEHQEWTDAVSAWDLAVTAHQHHHDPADYIRALDQLSQFGVNVDEAKAFAQFGQNQS